MISVVRLKLKPTAAADVTQMRLQAKGAEKALLEDWGLALQEREGKAIYSGLPGRKPS